MFWLLSPLVLLLVLLVILLTRFGDELLGPIRDVMRILICLAVVAFLLFGLLFVNEWLSNLSWIV